MPTNDGFWLDQGQCTLPSWPQSAQHNPEEFIRACQSRPRTIPPQDPNLLPNRGFWLDQGQCTLPSWPQSAQHNPEEFIRACQSRPRTIPPQDPNLLPKSQVFQERKSVV